MRPISMILLSALVAGACSPAPAATQQATAEPAMAAGEPCDIPAFVGAAGGLDVRARPDTSAPVIGHIEGTRHDAENERDWMPSMRLIEGRDGWLKIDNVEDETNSEMPARPMFEGSGWVQSEGVVVITQTGQMFAAPDHASEIVMQGAREGDYLEDFAAQETVMGCRGDWIDAVWVISTEPDMPSEAGAVAPSARVPGQPGRVRGWLTGTCGIQETTCDGVFGNRP